MYSGGYCENPPPKEADDTGKSPCYSVAMKTAIEPSDNPAAFHSHLVERNLIHNETPNLLAHLQDCHAKGKVPSIYAGFDPSAPSLQVGNLVPALMLRRAQLTGLRPLVLLGGATGLIGDPSGKKAERNLLDKDTTENNLAKIKQQLSHFVDASPGKYQMKFVNNYDWFKSFGFIEFLRNVGKHITVNYMIAKDSVKLRMETGISYAEFGYMLIQGYDFLHLFETENCLIQAGGSDQWGNMTTGLELIRRKHGAEAHAVSIPLLTDSAGNKLGKTEDGALYLDANMTSPYQFYQYWLNQADADVGKILRSLTLLTMDYIRELEERMAKEPESRIAQRILAFDLTSTVHGEEAALSVEKAAKVMFSKDPESLNHIDAKTLQFLAREVPSSEFKKSESIGILDLLVRAKLCESKGEARRSLQGNAVSLNRVKITDEKYIVAQDKFANRPFLLLGLGKAKLHLVRLTD